MRKLFILGAILVLLGAGCSSNPTTATKGSAGTAGTLVSASKTYTMAEVQAANTAEKCWAVVRGNVYDLTSAENSHPGGKQAILSMCGKDASAGFENKHGGQRKPEQELQGLQIGVLKQ
jgi:cytochrome b involved in lipid metabolism